MSFSTLFYNNAPSSHQDYRCLDLDLNLNYELNYALSFPYSIVVSTVDNCFYIREGGNLKRRLLSTGAQTHSVAASDVYSLFCIDQNGYLWCNDSTAQKIFKYDSDLESRETYTRKADDSIPSYYKMRFNETGNLVIILGYSDNYRIACFNVSSLDGGDPLWSTVIGEFYVDLAADLDGNGYVTAGETTRYVKKYRASDGALQWSTLGGDLLAYNAKLNSIFTIYKPGGGVYKVRQIDCISGDVIADSVDLGSSIDGVAVSKTGEFVYVAELQNFVSTRIYAFDSNNNFEDNEPVYDLYSVGDGYGRSLYLDGDPAGHNNYILNGGFIMAEVSGRHLLAALKKSVEWNTDIQIGANDGFLFLNENLGILARESVPNESIGATDAFISCTDKLNTPADDKTIEFELIFEMFELMTALCLGTAGAPSAGTDGYTHTLRPKRDLAGIFATFAKEPIDGSIMHVYPSIKIKGLEFSGAAGEIWKCTATAIASKFTNSPGVIVAGDFNNVTFRKKCGRIPFNACQIWMNTQSGDAVATGDAIHPSSLSFSFMRELDAYHASTNDTDCDAYAVQEPVENGYPEIKMTLEFPIFSADTYITAVHADTHYKMKINFVGALIGTDYYTWSVYFPNMELLNAEAAFDGAGKVVHPLEFRLKSVATPPTGMTYGDPFYMTVINTISTNLLA